MRGAALALAASVTAAGCGGGTTTAIPVHILMQESCEWDGQPVPLVSQQLTCGGGFRLELYDAQSEKLDEHCSTFDPGVVASDVPLVVGFANPQFGALQPGGTFKLLLEVSSPATVNACLEDEIDRPPPSDGMLESIVFFGESEMVTLMEGSGIVLPLECGSAPPPCEGPPIVVRELTATVRHLESNDTLEDAFVEAGAEVHAGFPVPVDDGVRWDFLPAGPLFYNSVGIWSGTIQDQDGGVIFRGCVGTLVEDGNPLTMPIASCDGTDFDQYHAYARAYFLEPWRVEELAVAAGAGTRYEQGLVIGRVLNAANQPVANAIVNAGQGVTVRYLNAEANGLNTSNVTSSSGWFLLDVDSFPPETPRCCDFIRASTFTATGMSYAPIGLLDGMVTAVVIQL